MGGFSKTEILLGLLIFYAVLSVFIGLISDTLQTDLGEETGTTGSFSWLGNTFIGNIITGYSSLPSWILITIFSPFVTIIGWIIVSSFTPTANGGS